MKIVLNLIFCLYIVTILSSCSLFKSSSDNTTVHNTVSQVVLQYLQYSFLAKTEAIKSMIVKNEFLKNQSLSEDEYDFKLVSLSSHWIPDKNPLVQLEVLRVDVSEDEASVFLKRRGSNFPELKFNLIWTGSSWAVVDDNIFGKGEIYETSPR